MRLAWVVVIVGVGCGDNLRVHSGDEPGIALTAVSGHTHETGAHATFEVALASRPEAEVTLALESDDPGEGMLDIATVAFTPDNWTSAQLVTITGIDDHVDDGDVDYHIVLAAIVSEDVAYAALPRAEVLVTNDDDDTAGITVGAISNHTAEPGATATFTVVLDSEPTAGVTIELATDDATEATTDLASLSFDATNWSAARTVVVTGVDDGSLDGDITYHVELDPASSSDPRYSMLAPALFAVVNDDDELPTCGAWSGDDFEDGDLVGWTLSSGAIASVDATTGADGSTTSLRVEDWSGRISYSHAPVQPTRITVWTKVDPVSLPVSASNYIVFGDEVTIANDLGVVYMYAASGTWNLYNNTSAFALQIGSVVIGRWERFDFDLDWTARTVDVRVNGVLAASDYAFRSTTANVVNTLRLFNLDPDAVAHYDQIQVVCP